MKRIAIIGASGHGKVVADIARLNHYKEIVFLDDDRTLILCGRYPVVGVSAYSLDYVRKEYDLVVAIGNAEIRKKMQEQIEAEGHRCATLIHPSAVISEDVEVGSGTVVMANAVINPGTKIGKGCIINTGATVDHDNVLGDYVHISVGAHLAGTVEVQERTWIGVGAIVSNNIAICSDCMIGAGAVVVKNIEEEGVYVGVPARKVK
ncbi:MAG: acetyltransferase [Lachnospiraceae bacterium]